MNIYILRHASAGTRRPNPLLDAKRPLDREGKQHCLHLAHLLNALHVSFDLIVSSPLKRSLQTAQLVATETGYESSILQSTALAPEATLPDFDRLLRDCKERENLLLVGHSPNIQLFLSSLLTPPAAALLNRNGASSHPSQLAPNDLLPEPDLNRNPDPTQPSPSPTLGPLVRLRKGSIARLLYNRRPAVLQALLDPRLVRALYATSTKSSLRKTSRK